MNSGGGDLREALISAGYPRPVVVDEPGQLTLSWGTGVGVREMCVSPSEVVTVWVARTPDAVFALGPSRQSAADWVSLLHPLIAEPIARTSESPCRVVELVTNIVRSASVVRLEHDADSATTYAVYTDNARVWVSAMSGPETVASLSGTARGRQLGISSDTMIAIPTAHSGTVMINPDFAVAAAIEDRGRWSPAVAFRRGGVVSDRADTNDVGGAFRSPLLVSRSRISRPTIRLSASRHGTYDDAIDDSVALLRTARADESSCSVKEVI